MRLRVVVGASAVHGVNGAWGILWLGLFANGVYGQGLNGVAHGVTGLFYGDAGQFVAEVIGILANIAWVAPVAALLGQLPAGPARVAGALPAGP